MKRIIVSAVMAAFVISFTGCAGDLWVTERPVEPVYVRPVAPGPDYVWVDGEWYISGGRYTYRNGYWAHPRGRSWQAGSWQNRGNSWHWQRGHWR